MKPDVIIRYENKEAEKLREAIKYVELAIDLVDNNDLMEAHYSLIMKLYQLTGDIK